MAAGYTFTCSSCARTIDAWDDGNPYVVDASGRKRYVYHPDPERERAVGRDDDVLCLACGVESRIDSQAPQVCPACASADTVVTVRLAGCTCPFCRDGTFGNGEMTMIS